MTPTAKSKNGGSSANPNIKKVGIETIAQSHKTGLSALRTRSRPPCSIAFEAISFNLVHHQYASELPQVSSISQANSTVSSVLQCKIRDDYQQQRFLSRPAGWRFQRINPPLYPRQTRQPYSATTPYPKAPPHGGGTALGAAACGLESAQVCDLDTQKEKPQPRPGSHI